MEKSIDNKIPLKAQSPGHGLSRKRIICMAIVFAAGTFRIIGISYLVFHFLVDFFISF